MTHRTATMPVWEVMSPTVETVQPGTTIAELVRLFDQHDYNAFPVVEPGNALVGLVTKLDLLRLLGPDSRFELPRFSDLASVRVDQIMRHGVVTVEPDDPAAAAADLMVSSGLHSLPVVERHGGPPLLRGMVSRGDLLRGLRVETGAEGTGPAS
jgi:CBS domain-containing protein